MMEHASHRLRARRLGIDTHSESVVFLRKDCPVCRSEEDLRQLFRLMLTPLLQRTTPLESALHC